MWAIGLKSVEAIISMFDGQRWGMRDGRKENPWPSEMKG